MKSEITKCSERDTTQTCTFCSKKTGKDPKKHEESCIATQTFNHLKKKPNPGRTVCDCGKIFLARNSNRHKCKKNQKLITCEYCMYNFTSHKVCKVRDAVLAKTNIDAKLANTELESKISTHSQTTLYLTDQDYFERNPNLSQLSRSDRIRKMNLDSRIRYYQYKGFSGSRSFLTKNKIIIDDMFNVALLKQHNSILKECGHNNVQRPKAKVFPLDFFKQKRQRIKKRTKKEKLKDKEKDCLIDFGAIMDGPKPLTQEEREYWNKELEEIKARNEESQKDHADRQFLIDQEFKRKKANGELDHLYRAFQEIYNEAVQESDRIEDIRLQKAKESQSHIIKLRNQKILLASDNEFEKWRLWKLERFREEAITDIKEKYDKLIFRIQHDCTLSEEYQETHDLFEWEDFFETEKEAEAKWGKAKADMFKNNRQGLIDLEKNVKIKKAKDIRTKKLEESEEIKTIRSSTAEGILEIFQEKFDLQKNVFLKEKEEEMFAEKVKIMAQHRGELNNWGLRDGARWRDQISDRRYRKFWPKERSYCHTGGVRPQPTTIIAPKDLEKFTKKADINTRKVGDSFVEPMHLDDRLLKNMTGFQREQEIKRGNNKKK